MFDLRFIIYFICFFIFVHFGLHFFDIDVFELFEKKNSVPSSNPIHKQENVDDNEISDTIGELEKSIQELKDVSSI